MRKFLLLPLLVLCLLQLSSCGDNASDEEFKSGLYAYEVTNYRQAYLIWRPLADKGHEESQYRIGDLYENGLGVLQDYKKAEKWYKLSAEQGNAEAQFRVGSLRIFISQDYFDAVKWYHLSAKQGHAKAQETLILTENEIGNLYYYGRGVPRNYFEAEKWYRLSAEKGYAEAEDSLMLTQFNLGLLYHEGIDIEQDYKKAVDWYRLVAEQGHAEAQFNLGTLYSEGKGVSQDYDEAVKWFRLAVEQGFKKAHISLGELYEKGKGVPQDYKKAVNLYYALSKGLNVHALERLKALAEQGILEAQYNLGVLYLQSHGVLKNHREGMKWYGLAVEQGHSEARKNFSEVLYKLGVQYEKRKNNYKEAVNWYRLAAEQGHSEARKSLSEVQYKLEAQSEAQYNLGSLYYLGEDITQNNIYAYMWMSIAKVNGNEKAKEELELVKKAMTPDELKEAKEKAKRCMASGYSDCD